MSAPAATLGLILNGGLGRRMGGADKGLLILAGRPMLAHVADRLAPQCGAIALSANGDPLRFSPFGLAIVADDSSPGAGPLAGVLAGLELAARMGATFTHVATAPADVPLLPMDFVARLHEAHRGDNAVIAVAASRGRRHHAAALWPVDLAQDLRHTVVSEGLRKVETFQARYAVAVAEWPCIGCDPFFNVNAPEDLARAEAMVRSFSGGGL